VATRQTIGRISTRIDALASRRWARFTPTNMTDQAWLKLEARLAELKAKRAERGVAYQPTQELEHWTDEELTRELFEMGVLTEDDFKPD
jgi:hypothetical protein